MLKVLGKVQPKSLTIAAAIVNAGIELALPDMVITHGRDGKHTTIDSKHYTDEALDFRTKHLSFVDKQLLVVAVRRRLGEDYDVLLEDAGTNNEHGHAEHDPH